MATRKACSTATPWGRADDSIQLTRGVNWYSTPSHGGLGVTLAWAAQNLTPAAQELGERWGGKLWYEEDCAYMLVFHECPSLDVAMHPKLRDMSTLELVEDHAKVLRLYYPQYFDSEFKRICRENPVVPPVQVGDYITLTTKTYGPVCEDQDRFYRISYGRIRKSHVMECATVLKRASVVVWQRPDKVWAERRQVA
jgi:hypothetical protein